MQLLRLNTLSLACFVSLGLVSCGGGNAGQLANSSVTKSTFAFDASDNLYLSTDGTNYSEVATKGIPEQTTYTTQGSDNMAAMCGSAGVISVSPNWKDWSDATSPATAKVNGLTVSLALYDVIAKIESKKSANSLSSSASVIQPSSFVAVGMSGNIQVVSSSQATMSLSEAVKQHKLKYRQVAAVTNEDLYSVAQDFKTDNIVGVGAGNTGVISTDGTTFKAFTFPTTSTSATSKDLTVSTPNYYSVNATPEELDAVGQNGEFQKSVNGGQDWTKVNTGTSETLLATKTVYDASGKKSSVIIAGLNNTLKYSGDGGETFKDAVLPKGLAKEGFKVDFRDVALNPDNTETVYGVEVDSSSNLSARDVFLRKYSLGAAATVQTQVVLQSKDGGKTWVQKSVLSPNGTSSSAVSRLTNTPFLTTLQNVFNNAKTNPTTSFAATVFQVVTLPYSLVLSTTF